MDDGDSDDEINIKGQAHFPRSTPQIAIPALTLRYCYVISSFVTTLLNRLLGRKLSKRTGICSATSGRQQMMTGLKCHLRLFIGYSPLKLREYCQATPYYRSSGNRK